MKKLLLATIIASTFSSAVMANGSEMPYTTEQKVAAFNAVMVKGDNAANIVKNESGKYEITFMGTDQSGDPALETIELTKRDEEAMKQRMFKVAADKMQDRMDGGVVGRENLDSAIAYRMNNADKIELTNEQKVKGINTLIGEERIAIQTSANGEVYLVDKSTGQAYSEEQIKDMADSGKSKVKEEAAKRTEHGVAPVAPIEDAPVIEPVFGSVGDGVVREYAAAAQQTQAEFNFQTQTDIANLYSEIERLDEKMDSVMAGTHAITNARPFLSGQGKTAIGVGTGFAGNSSSVAIGAAHSFTNSLSMSLTVNATTGSYSEVSGGAGVQYQF